MAPKDSVATNEAPVQRTGGKPRAERQPTSPPSELYALWRVHSKGLEPDLRMWQVFRKRERAEKKAADFNEALGDLPYALEVREWDGKRPRSGWLQEDECAEMIRREKGWDVERQ